jgi:hypothetical protein
MKIKELTLFTNKLSEQKDFLCKTFGFNLIEEEESEFTVQIGDTKLTYEESESEFIYHYCFLIPSNKLNESITWLQERLEIISYENGRIIEPASKEWNADSLYFYDSTGNILEFIARYDLKNHSPEGEFDVSQILSVNEIGMPANDISVLNETLEKKMNSKLWTGNLIRFGANGTQEGLFIMVNYNIKKTWFPTDLLPIPAPFHGHFESEGRDYQLKYEGEKLSISLIC